MRFWLIPVVLGLLLGVAVLLLVPEKPKPPPAPTAQWPTLEESGEALGRGTKKFGRGFFRGFRQQ